jgi:hypothetical protein
MSLSRSAQSGRYGWKLFAMRFSGLAGAVDDENGGGCIDHVSFRSPNRDDPCIKRPYTYPIV